MPTRLTPPWPGSQAAYDAPMASLRVFLSSTALDLGAHRRIADDPLLRLQQQSVQMER